MMQRALDILFAGTALLILSPLLILVAIVLRITGEGEILFLQERIGVNFARFKLYKFATMLRNSPASGTVTVANDPRILPFGRVLRATKINELPQLANILLGDMSVIGPRPLTEQAFSAYAPEVQRVVVQVRPGLSGIGSIIFRGEEELLRPQYGAMSFYPIIAAYKGKLEAWYVAHQSLRTYIKAILVTCWVIVFPRSRIVWTLFPDLPPPPAELATKL